MTSPNLSAILDRPGTEIERPKPLPVGTYHCRIKGLPRFDQSTQKKTDYAEFTLIPMAALDDVDLDDLKAVLHNDITGEVKKLNELQILHTLYLTANSAWRLKEFLEHCGIDVNDGRRIGELIDETPNKEVFVTLKHEQSDDGKAVYARVANTAAVE